MLLFTLFDLDLDDVVRVALWLKLSLPGGKTISGSMLFTYISSLQTKSFSELRFEPINLNKKDIVKIFSHYLEGFLVQPLFPSLLVYKSQSSLMFSSLIFPICKLSIGYVSVTRM